MKRLRPLPALFLLLLGGCGPSAGETEALDWFRQNAIQLASVEAGRGFHDLQPLKDVFGEARIVALGESSHGSREIFQLHHRLLEFLAGEMGFTRFALETGFAEALAINDYVLGASDEQPNPLTGRLWGIHQTEEMLAMVRWMRRYNQDLPPQRRIRFYGFDCQSSRTAARNVWQYLDKVAPERALFYRAAVGFLTEKDIEFIYRERDDAKIAAIEKHIPVLAHDFLRAQREYVARSSQAEWTLVVQQARTLLQSALIFQLREQSEKKAQDLRDRFMAHNLRWILEQEGTGAKAVLWAHNWHVSYAEGTMGYHLKGLFGPAMVSVGFAFNQGSFRAADVRAEATIKPHRNFSVGPAPEGSLEALLAQVDGPVFVVDLRRASGRVRDWLDEKRPMRDISAVFEDEESLLRKIAVGQRYDVLIFLKESTAVRPLRAGRGD